MSQPEPDLMSPQREMDLRALIMLAWGMRYHLVVAFVAVTIAYWGYWLVRSDEPSRPTYSRVVQFVFDGVEQGQYPNGSPFHIGDVIAPRLTSSLYEIHGLRERGVPAEVFANAFSIEPYTPEYQYILERSEQLAERATSAELVVLQDRISAELDRASMGAALLSFRPLNPVPLTEADIGKLLLDLPELWAARAIEQYGVLELDVPRYSPNLFDPVRIGELEYLDGLEAIRRNAGLLLDSVAALRGMPHGHFVRDPESSGTLIDVERTVNEVIAYDVSRLSAHIVQRGVARDLAALTTGYEYQVEQLDASVELATARLADATRVVVSLGGLASVRAAPPPELSGVPAPESPSIPEVSSMAALVDEMLARELEAARFARDLASRKLVLASLRERDGEPSETDMAAVEGRLAAITTALASQVEVVERIHSLLSKENFGYAGRLYRVGGGGLVVPAPVSLRASDVYIYILLMFGVLTVVLVVGNAMSGRPS